MTALRCLFIRNIGLQIALHEWITQGEVDSFACLLGNGRLESNCEHHPRHVYVRMLKHPLPGSTTGYDQCAG